jgi:asparagine synthase (glutamine-hydrolysing)
MSAIAGIITKDISIDKRQLEKLEKTILHYNHDRFDRIIGDSFYFSCAHQYFTPEAASDSSPIQDCTSQVIFTGDIYLYNRKDIIDFLCGSSSVAKDQLSKEGDCDLVFKLYMKQGIDFINLIDGVFSIAILDNNVHHIYLITDYVSARHLAYTLRQNYLCFSTLFEPILQYIGYENTEIDEEWICCSYSDFTADEEKIAGRSPYAGIFRVEPGHYIDIDTNSFTKTNIQYWNPLQKAKKIRNQKDSYYKELMISTLQKDIKGMMRARKNYGIMLSGGLDSSTVASFIAKELSAFNPPIKLYSYTQVPDKDYKIQDSRFVIEDETEEVLYNQEKYTNIECKFIPSMDKSCFAMIPRLPAIFDEPVKPILNQPNLYALQLSAQQDGCSVLFSGQGGNSTISYGKITTYIFQNLSGGHFIKAFKEANSFCKLYRANRINFLKYYFSYKRSYRKRMKEEENLLRNDLIKKYRLKETVYKAALNRGGTPFDSEEMWNNFTYMPLTLQHIGYYDTVSSLTFGHISLDPTFSKNMIELCLSLPIDCFVKNGKERRAVRDYMQGIVSDKILNNLKRRGVQAADYSYRANKYWDESKDIIISYLKSKELYKYLDKEKIDKLIEEITNNEYNMSKEVVSKTAVTAALSCFLDNYTKNKHQGEHVL